MMIEIVFKYLKRYKFSILILVIIYALCLIPSTSNQTKLHIIPHFDKIIHFGMFFTFVFIFSIENKNKKTLYKLLIISILVALSTEFSQELFTNSRQFDFIDIIADLFGAISGFLTHKYFLKIKSKLNF